MIAPKYILKELELIDPMFFAVYNPFVKEKTNMSYGKNRWQIRKWKGVYPKKMSLWDTDASEVFITICQESYSNERGLYDSGYKSIDMTDVEAIRESHWFKLRAKEKVEAMDERNRKLNENEEKELDYQSKYVAKRIWRNKHEPTVHLSGREWRV